MLAYMRPRPPPTSSTTSGAACAGRARPRLRLSAAGVHHRGRPARQPRRPLRVQRGHRGLPGRHAAGPAHVPRGRSRAALAALLDFSVRPNGALPRGRSREAAGAAGRAAPVLAGAAVQRRTLREALVEPDAICARCSAPLRAAEPVTMLGVEVLGLSILSIKPTPEIGRALEAGGARGASARVGRGDLCAAERRRGAGAADQGERAQHRDRGRGEAAPDPRDPDRRRHRRRGAPHRADRARSANERKDADARGYALGATLEPLRVVDWQTLMAIRRRRRSAA